MSENENSKNNYSLFLASLLICFLRYSAILFPDNKYFSIYKMLVEIPQIYYLDFASVVIFSISIWMLFRDDIKKNNIIYFTQMFAFAAVVPVWNYVILIAKWIWEGGFSDWDKIWRNVKNILILGAIIFAAVILFKMYRHRNLIKKFFGEIKRTIQKDIFMAQFIAIFLVIHIVRIWIYFWGLNSKENTKIAKLLVEYDPVLVIAFSIALLIIVVHYRRKNFTPAAWTGIFLCFLGMSAFVTNFNENIKFCKRNWKFVICIVIIIAAIILLWNLEYKKIKKMLKRYSKQLFLATCLTPACAAVLIYLISKILKFVSSDGLPKCFYIVFQIFLLLTMILAFLSILILLVKFFRYISTIKFENIEIWKTFIEIIGKGKGIYLCFYLIGSLAVIAATIMVFINWSGISHGFLSENDDPMEILLQIMGVLISAVILVVLVIFTLCNIGTYLIRTLSQINEQKSNSNRYYITHGTSGFFSLILSVVSWYIYTKFEFSDEDMMGIAGKVFGYFALPVIMMIWYSITFYLLNTILGKNDLESKRILRLIKKRAYELTESFINSIFAPFRLVFGYLDVLGGAVLDEDKSLSLRKKIKMIKSSQMKKQGVTGNIKKIKIKRGVEIEYETEKKK